MGVGKDLDGNADIVQALGRLESDRAETRKHAVSDIRRAISHSELGAKSVTLDDKGYHAILEGIFSIVRNDTSRLLRASKQTETRLSSRISDCAGLVRSVVEFGLQKIRLRTVRSIIDHISQCIPTVDEGYCGPLVSDYFKALAALLSHQAHVENLSRTEWQSLVDLNVQCCHSLKNEASPVSSQTSSRPGDSFAVTASARSNKDSAPNDRSIRNSNHSELQSSDEDIMLCLRQLTAGANAPVLDRSREILESVMSLLRVSSITKTHQNAFIVISQVLAYTCTSYVQLSSLTIADLLPIFVRDWARASQTQRESILAVLLQGEAFFDHLFTHHDAEAVLVQVNELLKKLKVQYVERSRDQLLMDDLALGDSAGQSSHLRPLRINVANIHMGAVRAEEPWSVLSISAALYTSSEKYMQRHQIDDMEVELRVNSKRQKRDLPSFNLLQMIRNPKAKTILYALQVSAFMFDQSDILAHDLCEYLQCLVSLLSLDDPKLVSWVTFALLSLQAQPWAQRQDNELLWTSAWRAIFRNISNSTTCKVSCEILSALLDCKLVQYTSVSGLVEGMLSSSALNGPAAYDTSVNHFWSTLIALRQQYKLQFEPDVYSLVIRSIFQCWNISRPSDYHHPANIARSDFVESLLRVFFLVLGIEAPASISPTITYFGYLSQVQATAFQRRHLIRYLLGSDLESQHPASIVPENTSPVCTESSTIDPRYGNLRQLLVGSIHQDCVLLRTALSTPKYLTSESLPAITQFIVASHAILHLECVNSGQAHNVLGELTDLQRQMAGLIQQSDKEANLEKSFLDSVGRLVSSIDLKFATGHPLSRAIIALSRSFGLPFWVADMSESKNGEDETELMDIDVDLTSLATQRKEVAATLNTCHVEANLVSSSDAYEASTKAKLCWLSRLDPDAPNEPEQYAVDPGSSISYLVHSSATDFLLCAGALRDLLRADILTSDDDADTLLQFVQQRILQQYEFRNCETATLVGAECLSSFAGRWTQKDNDDLSVTGAEMYAFFIEKVYQDAKVSRLALKGLANFFSKILQTSSDYTCDMLVLCDEALPSSRTTLLQILEKGDLLVKFDIGPTIAGIFGLFVLNEHAPILSDILDTLPRDLGWIEGIAVRVKLLGDLAISWPTVLRECVYGIFETGGRIPTSLKFAEMSLGRICKALNLSTPQELFRLFCRQILYTWLEVRNIKSIPFASFGYTTLSALLQDQRDEIVAQVLMRGNDEQLMTLESCLGKSRAEFVTASFAKTAAYCISRDIALPPDDSKPSERESQLRKMLGRDKYSQLITHHLPAIIAHLFLSTDREDQFPKAVKKLPAYSAASAVYDDILAIGHSDKDLPPFHQPTFKAKYLLSQLQRLCSRASVDVQKLWSQGLFMSTLRFLVDAIHPALGSLYSCSILRKIRILLSITGPLALRGYPLRMTLHALRPFLTQSQCADDSIGMVQYLLQNGQSFLHEVPAFFLGYGISTLLEMKDFLSSTQDSTTQESAFKSTMSKAASYNHWLISYLRSYEPTSLSHEEAARCTKLALSAISLSHVEIVKQGLDQEGLISAFFDDLQAEKPLLSPTSQDLILSFLDMWFKESKNAQDYNLEDDRQAFNYVSAVFKTCRSSSSRSSYLQWAARFLGRTYSIYGMTEAALVREMDPTSMSSTVTTHNKLSFSRLNLLRLLSDALDRKDRQEVGLAEKTLIAAVTKSSLTGRTTECEYGLDPYLYDAMLCLDHSSYYTDMLDRGKADSNKLGRIRVPVERIDTQIWIEDFSEALSHVETEDPLMSAMQCVTRGIEHFSQDALPFILHLALLSDIEGRRSVKLEVSRIFKDVFELAATKELNIDLTRVLLKAFLYLRTQAIPHEKVKCDRSAWLDLSFQLASAAAEKCSMFKTALLLLEIERSEEEKYDAASKRQERARTPSTAANDMLLRIYQNLHEEDAFFGVKQNPNFATVMAQLEYDQSNFKSLSFQSALHDAEVRESTIASPPNQRPIMQVLSGLNLDGLAHSLPTEDYANDPKALQAAFNSARNLQRWDLTVPGSNVGTSASIYTCLRDVNRAASGDQVLRALDQGLIECLDNLLYSTHTSKSSHAALAALSILTETEQILSSRSLSQCQEIIEKFSSREHTLHFQRYDHVREISACRQTVLGMLTKQGSLRALCKLPWRETQLMECQALLRSISVCRKSGALQDALNNAAYLTRLARRAAEHGVQVQAATDIENAEVLWSLGERDTAVRMLSQLIEGLQAQAFPVQDVRIGKPGLLARLGNYTAAARLERPDLIIDNILKQAVQELGTAMSGQEAAEVFHEFASFCDGQLQNSDSIADFHRLQQLRARKKSEVQDLDRMIKTATQSRDRENLKSHRNKAQQWFDLDDKEYRRLESSREVLVIYCLENYLRSLRASDKFENDALRFSTLWLENHENGPANKIVGKYLAQIPTQSFAPLMNQWSSRLLDVRSQFQDLLFDIVVRICIEHPYHGMYQIFASSKTKGGKDEVALSRHAAANKVVEELKRSVAAQKIWLAVHNMNVTFVRFAQERLDDPVVKPGSKVPLRKSQTGARVEQDVMKMKIPPPTMKVKLRADHDYSGITTIARFLPDFSVATGISMPKITTALGTDGHKYKQLFKSGNDDLRQDAIMEQVFDAVSSLLQAQRITRQRDLKIRTYKVLPLTATAGVIEFVSNTIPLHDYLLPAHQRHHPKDLKPNACRKHIADAQSRNQEQRIKQFQKVCEQFHPVFRYFFQEQFESPDEWYGKRLAYTRSTAAISILGHVLGLGDRHGHNILLDKATGEVVHIDLGIAFEQGRVLPVPEVVPFRLTRDLVDGMGITGTEGVFRRCCEFTLQALRNEADAIMSILDVLRYDPLYSWSLSPLRLKKMQEAQTLTSALPEEGIGPNEKRGQDGGEADRALLVVGKKLSPTLSVQATVNELIQQATDERNLAVLFCGWAAYA